MHRQALIQLYQIFLSHKKTTYRVKTVSGFFYGVDDGLFNCRYVISKYPCDFESLLLLKADRRVFMCPADFGR